MLRRNNDAHVGYAQHTFAPLHGLPHHHPTRLSGLDACGDCGATLVKRPKATSSPIAIVIRNFKVHPATLHSAVAGNKIGHKIEVFVAIKRGVTHRQLDVVGNC